MYSNTAAVARPDLQQFVLEGSVETSLAIGSKVLPVLLSDNKSGQYPIVKVATGKTHKNDVTTRAPGGSYGQLTRSYHWGTFDCVDRGLEEPIDDTVSNDLARFFSLEGLSAQLCAGQVVIGHEVRAAAAIMNTQFTATAAAVNYTETNIATINFMNDYQGARKRMRATGIEPNSVVMDQVIFDQVNRSTKFQNYMRGNRPADVTVNYDAAAVASALGIPAQNVLVGTLMVDANADGKNGALTSIWGTTYLWIGRISGAGQVIGGQVMGSVDGVGRTIVWNKEGGLYVTETYRDEKIRSDVVRVRQNTAEKVFNTNAGQLITLSYSAS